MWNLFFYNPTDIYIQNQQIVKVDNVEIYDKDGKLYLKDSMKWLKEYWQIR